MDHHQLYGPSLPQLGWVPAPRYLLRRERVLGMLSGVTPGKLLEIGCGPGTLLHELGERGFNCAALETSEAALKIARSINPEVRFCETAQPDWPVGFDYVMAFEVLEHIEDDRGALRLWHSWLKPGGTLLLSVPAHMSKWDATDDWAGHYRRYEAVELKKLLTEAGFSVNQFENYGFPLANLIAPLRARTHRKQLVERESRSNDREYNNAMSGITRPKETLLFPLLKSIPGSLLMRSAFWLQRVFAGQDLGNGYVLSATKLDNLSPAP
jgi:SAM-dependent methyltransferase